ncbi:MAG: hypothetical protein ACRDWW_08815 [Acidimicrobiales bacterium]
MSVALRFRRVVRPGAGARLRAAVALIVIALLIGAAAAGVLGLAVWGIAAAVRHAAGN